MATVTLFPLLGQAAELVREGKHDQAAQRTMAHLRQHPDEPGGLAQLGQIAMLVGALGQAEHFVRKALTMGARDPQVRRDLAVILTQRNRYDEALALYEALEQESDDPALPALRALVLSSLGRHAEALAIQERLVEQHGERPQFWIAYGHSLRAEGRVDDAIAAYRQSIAVDYEFGEAWWGLASIKRKVLTDADIELMRRGIAVAIDVRNSAPLHFALARALHDREQYQEAFEHYDTANRQRAESIRYDARELTDEVAETERAVDASFIARLPTAPVGDAIPIFIVSLPRSGTTLLEQILGSHPDIEPTGELPYVPGALRAAMEMATRRGRVTVPQLVANLSDEQAASIGHDYLRRVALHRKTGRRYFVDKLPHNWNNVLFIRRILPQARFIDIRRPAMDCCFSNFTQSFTNAHASSFALRDVGQGYVDYVRLMAHLDRIAPGLVHHQSYAALIEEPEPQIRAVLEYLGLPWDSAVLEFHKLDRVVRTPSSEQVRRPLNRDGIDVWKPYAEWLGPLRDVLGPLADQ